MMEAYEAGNLYIFGSGTELMLSVDEHPSPAMTSVYTAGFGHLPDQYATSEVELFETSGDLNDLSNSLPTYQGLTIITPLLMNVIS
jgi:hypothetical protein